MSTIIHLPVFGLVLTLVVYLGALWLHGRRGRPALLTPVFVTVTVVALVLEATGLSYAEYLRQVTVLTLLLGPATVALALPLLANGRALRSSAPAVLLTLFTGAVVSLGVTIGALTVFGTHATILRSVLPRSVTSPVALTIAETLKASTSLAVVLTILSGILGAVFAPLLLSLAGVRDERARGFAIGLTSHGIGTSRALAESPVAGGWSSAAMVLNALAMTAVLPLVAAWVA
ncbi:LrgB family protein [Brachybacterium endophyticum]|uniref:LrgB family protein n=1 Tax=Brachybacterium endophyticum TaxID=2182385 RepID=A0A2U2RKA3_9MICO|nr:LrgB family protein [Brachybacterium endophyticum]PWH06293.1 LrgB family protein [Brachybacterium endophyticum]